MKKTIRVQVTPGQGVRQVKAAVNGDKVAVDANGIGHFEAEPGEHFVHVFASGEPGALLKISIAGSEGLKLDRSFKISKHGSVAGLHKIKLHAAADPDDWPGPRLNISKGRYNVSRKR
jgi:hypothetical protein